MTPRRQPGFRFLAGACLLFLTVVGCVAYVQRDQILVHYHIWSYAQRGGGESATWLGARPMLASPHLVESLASNDPIGCERTGDLLHQIIERHADPTNPHDSHVTLTIASEIQKRFPSLSEPGRCQAVRIALGVLGIHLNSWSPSAPTALETAGAVIADALRDRSGTVQEHMLRSLAVIWRWNGTDGMARSLVHEWKRTCYELAAIQFRSPAESIRSAAATAVIGAPFHHGELLLATLILDRSSLVYKPALLALEAAQADCLSVHQKSRIIELLHEGDEEVCRAAVAVLRQAGLDDSTIALARLMKHPKPEERLRVVKLVQETDVIESQGWLLELSHDPAPEVRIAAARAASESDHAELLERLRDMADHETDEAVRAVCRELLALRMARGPREPLK